MTTQKVIIKEGCLPHYLSKVSTCRPEKSPKTANSKSDISPSKGDFKSRNRPHKVIFPPQKVIIKLLRHCKTITYQPGKHLKICFKKNKTTTDLLQPSKGDNNQKQIRIHYSLSLIRRSLREQIISPCGALLLKRKNIWIL